MARYIKLEDGSWGARTRQISSIRPVKSGGTITIRKRGRVLHSRTIDEVIEEETCFSESFNREFPTGYYIVSLVNEPFLTTSFDDSGKLVATF